MKITELLDVKSIALNVNVSSKDETIDKLIDLMYESGKISDKSEYKKGILAREALSTTGIGDGIAIPHAQVATVKKAGLAAMTIQNGVDYDSLDGKPVYLCFMIAAPQDGCVWWSSNDLRSRGIFFKTDQITGSTFQNSTHPQKQVSIISADFILIVVINRLIMCFCQLRQHIS